MRVVTFDQLLAHQAARVRRLTEQPRFPASHAEAADPPGSLITVAGAAAVVELVTWPPDAFERVVLGDRTASLHLVALPDPHEPAAAEAVTTLVAEIRSRIAPIDGLRTQLFLRWPDADTAMHAHWEQAGLQVDALWCTRPLGEVPASPAADVIARPALPTDAEQVGELAVEEVRFHLPLTPFTRDVPVVRPHVEAAVREPTPDRPVFVAERAGEVIGYAACRVVDTPGDGLVRPGPPGRTGHFLSVGVRADARDAGAGRAIVRAAAQHLARLGVERYSAAFLPTNRLASAFWTGRGFQPLWRYWAAILD